ncbi:hypothetical protein IscW_ISCW002536 [Ixodes scapularis]|uniref:Uncharacterized protein n=1 Tax=Ixodes scapularis TaxID=6945 RepID=B7P7M9_IXOSC|nr:hypothetical protein IscW_ISCW002536 [Ixodes scapularis]|eukprot:XP_002399361.1 hypothetical protein IscW_ISCW002536 [Ixodes scapularis]
MVLCPGGLNPVFLRFKDAKLESQFWKQPDPQFAQYSVASAAVFGVIVAIQMLTLNIFLSELKQAGGQEADPPAAKMAQEIPSG